MVAIIGSNRYLMRNKYRFIENIKQVVKDLREGVIPIYPDELLPKMLEVGRTSGTKEFEKSVKDLLAALAKRIPSTEYRQEFEKYI
jgi:hypothetical protein